MKKLFIDYKYTITSAQIAEILLSTCELKMALEYIIHGGDITAEYDDYFDKDGNAIAAESIFTEIDEIIAGAKNNEEECR